MKEADAQSLESLQRDLAERDRKGDTGTGRKDAKDPPRGVQDPGVVLSLQKQLSDRDRKIEELASQLEALKRIDQEMRDKVRPVRPPSTIGPSPTVPEPVTP
jgi:predicted RNase H-like nuclease (RuvC/YqgF family)